MLSLAEPSECQPHYGLLPIPANRLCESLGAILLKNKIGVSPKHNLCVWGGEFRNGLIKPPGTVAPLSLGSLSGSIIGILKGHSSESAF